MSEQSNNEMIFQIQRIYTMSLLKRQMRRTFSRKTGSQRLNLIWIPHHPTG
jgi:hypothetical protein